MDIEVRISSVTMSDGTIIKLDRSDALIIVGANNAGKSQFLRDVESLSARSYGSVYKGKVVQEIEFSSPPKDEMYQKIQRYRVNETEIFAVNGVRVHQNHVINAFNSGLPGVSLGETSRFFVKRVSSDDRLSVVSPSPALTENGPETPGQLLYDDDELVVQVSALFKRAFNKELFLDYRSGGSIPLYVGAKPAVPEGADRISNEYVKLVRACDKLHEQGDGMKSFGGIVLSTLVSKFNITLIDEPEAFLHPPQERIIGKVIAEESDGQVICSTHSTNVLQGFLESARDNIRVLRISRDSDVNKINEISSEEISALWRDPVFRFSTALDALFHDRAVLCEAEPDCRFYEALERSISTDTRVDTHYIPCAGKAAFPKFSRALRKLGVPVIAILDIDVLNDETTIKNIFEAQGGDWKRVQPLWRRLDAAVRKGVKPDELDSIKKRVGEILDHWTEGSAPMSQIAEAISQRRPWAIVKEQGIDALPAGEAQDTAEALINLLAEHGVYPLPVGTMEKFVRNVGNHGNKWLSVVFERYSLNDPKLQRARQFVSFALSL